MDISNGTLKVHPGLVVLSGIAEREQIFSTLCILTLLALVSLVGNVIHKDYMAFLALGPGGTPCTILGYLRITALRLFALRDPFTPQSIPNWLSSPAGYFECSKTLSTRPNFPRRGGPRPSVTGIAPHRQTTQRGTPKDFAALSAVILELAAKHPSELVIRTSCFEKHGTGLFSKRPVNKTCNGEVCHAHSSDGSLHMTLHPADAKIILNNGWGERHPLARGGWMSRFVPQGFVMIYTPRNDEELRVVQEIINAAAWWVAGGPLDGRTDSQLRDSSVDQKPLACK